jgi:hypothetical protein
MTGCVSPQHHCWFDGYFETTRHGGPDDSDTMCWQQLAGFSCTAQILSNLAWPTQSSTVSQAIPLETGPILWMIVSQEHFDIMLDSKSFADGKSEATKSSGNSCTSWASQQAEGVTTIDRSRKVCTLSRKMAKSTSHWDFFGKSGMHYLANLSTTAFDETPEDLFHNQHLDL